MERKTTVKPEFYTHRKYHLRMKATAQSRGVFSQTSCFCLVPMARGGHCLGANGEGF